MPRCEAAASRPAVFSSYRKEKTNRIKAGETRLVLPTLLWNSSTAWAWVRLELVSADKMTTGRRLNPYSSADGPWGPCGSRCVTLQTARGHVSPRAVCPLRLRQSTGTGRINQGRKLLTTWLPLSDLLSPYDDLGRASCTRRAFIDDLVGKLHDVHDRGEVRRLQWRVLERPKARAS